MNWILGFLFLMPTEALEKQNDTCPPPLQALAPSFAGPLHNSATYWLSGFVVKVTDGDTFVLLDSARRQFRVRLNGIDAPEKGQDFFQASRQSLGNMLQKKHVSVRYLKKDRYGRLLADVFVDGNSWINFEMIANGMAWHFKKYSSDKILADAERMARRQRMGIWQQRSPTAPWDYRQLRTRRERTFVSHPSGENDDYTRRNG